MCVCVCVCVRVCVIIHKCENFKQGESVCRLI